MTDFNRFTPPDRKPKQDKFLEPGWQKRLHDLVTKNPQFDLASKKISEVLQDAPGNVLVMDGNTPWDTLATIKILAERMPSNKKVSVVSPTAVDATALAYLTSATLVPEENLGETVGYATGKSGKIDPLKNKVVMSTPGNIARRILEGKVASNSTGAIIINGADSTNPYNQELLSVLREKHDEGNFPFIVLLPKEYKRINPLANFFSQEAKKLHLVESEEGFHLDTAPLANIIYEENELAYQDKVNKTISLLDQLLEEDNPHDAIVFVENNRTGEDIFREISQYQQKESLHSIKLLSSQNTLQENLSTLLDKPNNNTPSQKEIIITSLPAEALEIVKQFDVVIDLWESPDNFSNPHWEESERRANYTELNGVCYRLTTRERYTNSAYLDCDEQFSLSPEQQQKFYQKLANYGLNPKNFSYIFNNPVEPEVLISTNENVLRLQQTLTDLPSSTINLVNYFQENGQLELGLVIAACIRENRFVKANLNIKELIYHGSNTPHSDILLRLQILKDYLFSSKHSYAHQINEDPIDDLLNKNSLNHIKAMLTRWTTQLGLHSIDTYIISQQIEGLNNETLSKILIETMPQKVAYFESNYEEAMLPIDTTKTDYHKPGKRTIAPYSHALFYAVVDTFTTKDGTSFVTTAHPLKIEDVLKAFPKMVRLHKGVMHLSQETGKVSRTISIQLREEDHYNNKTTWRTLESYPETITGPEADEFIISQKNLSKKIELSLNVLNFILENTQDTLHTSARTRIKTLTRLRYSVQNETSENSIKETTTKINTSIKNLNKLAIKVAKANNWNKNWYTELQETLNNIPQIINDDEMAQGFIEDEPNDKKESLRKEIEKRMYDYISTQGINIIADPHQVIDTNSVIENILEEIT